MQTEDDKPAATGVPAGDLKDSTSYSPAGNHPTHHWQRAVIGTPGLGLGLAMAHGFVQQSPGRLEIDSRPGEGTENRMLFPIAHAARGAVPAPPAKAGGAAGQGSTGDSETILLVEDGDDGCALADRIRAALDRQSADPRRTANPIVPAEG